MGEDSTGKYLVEGAALGLDDDWKTSELGDDALKWAAAFSKTFPNCNVEESTMLAWFAMAIETAYDTRKDREQ